MHDNKKISVIFIFCFPFLFFSCSSPTQPVSFVPRDTTFFAGKIKFPNDSIYARSLLGTGSNWRTKRFLEKCKRQNSVRVGFIGGSITAGAIVSAENLRFSSLLCSALKGSFPNLSEVVEINAGSGGTTSRFACSRAQSDLFGFSPDLIVIEFAVNDYILGDSSYCQAVYEGLVRQCLLYKNDVPVILLFMSFGDGRNVQELQADVGRWYSLPMISYRDAIWPLIESDSGYWDTFFYNDPHPNDTGHRVCALLLYTYLKKALTEPENPSGDVPHFRYSDLYQNAGIMISGDTTITVNQSNWTPHTEENGRIGFSSALSGDSITFQSKSNEMTLAIDKFTSDTSGIHVVVDDKAVDMELNNYCSVAGRFLEPIYTSQSSSNHTVRIRHLKSQSFSIAYILFAGYPQ